MNDKRHSTDSSLSRDAQLTKEHMEEQHRTRPAEIIRYVRHDRGDRRHLIGAMVAFKRDRTSDVWYIGWSLKHKIDWAVYCDCPNQEEVIVDAQPFDKKIALSAARERAVNWNMAPCEAREIPDSILDDFIIFIDRAMRYFQTDTMPTWIPESINNDGFKDVIDEIYEERKLKKENLVNSLRCNLEWYHKQISMIQNQIVKLSPPVANDS